MTLLKSVKGNLGALGIRKEGTPDGDRISTWTAARLRALHHPLERLKRFMRRDDLAPADALDVFRSLANFEEGMALAEWVLDAGTASWRDTAIAQHRNLFIQARTRDTRESAFQVFSRNVGAAREDEEETSASIRKTLELLDEIGVERQGVNDRTQSSPALLAFVGRSRVAVDAHIKHFGHWRLDDDRDVLGDAALHYATRDASGERVRMLLGFGANPLVESWHGEIPLHRAVVDARLQPVRALLETDRHTDAHIDHCLSLASDPATEALLRAHQARQAMTWRTGGRVRPLSTD